MSWQITLYRRTNCCLCEEMKKVVRKVAERFPMEIEEVDVDGSPDLREEYGSEVPVLFVNGRKAFKYRVTERALKEKLSREARGGA